jgi:tetratricopeptide (TPR) repeat protein
MAYDAALQLRPAYPDAHRWRAETFVELKRYEDALRSLDQYLKIASSQGLPTGPESPISKDALAEAYLTRGLLRVRLKDGPGATDDYTQALALKPDGTTYAHRGWAHVLCEAPLLALHDFEDAIRLQPELADAYNGRGYARVKVGQYRQAVADAEEAIRRGPRTDRTLYNAARIYSQAAGKVDAEAAAKGLAGASALRSRYEGRAVELIRQALDLHSAPERRAFWQEFIGPDGALQPIRRTPEFARLTKIYARTGK